MKKYVKAKELLESNANKKEKKPIYATRKLSIGLVSCMLGLVMATPVVRAEETELIKLQPAKEASEPAVGSVEANDTPVPLENDETPQPGLDGIGSEGEGGLEIGPEIVGDPVTAAVKEPTVDPVFYDATTISGANLAKARVNKKTVIATVHVTLKGEDGTVKATLSVTPKSGTKWSVKLPEGKKVEKGDTVTVYQQIGEDKSPEATATAQPSKASTVTLTMPTGEIWIEQTSSNIVNDDEHNEAVKMLKDANTAIAGDIKSVEFSIDGTNHAYYEVTYTDGSTSGKVEATNLQIKTVTETSREAKLDKITVVDNVIKGKLEGEGPFDGIKVQLIIKVKKEKSGDFCTDKGCKIDKDSSKPVEVTVQDDGTFSYTLQEEKKESLELDQIVGVKVKEPHKFVSCSTTTVKPVTPEKTEVKDPRKLTAEDKKAIDAAIRTAYKAPDGTSKLPNGTGDWDEVLAVIQFDDSGNVKIFSGNDVAGGWDSDGHFVPEKNADGSLKVKEDAKPIITIPAKDLVLNIKPEKPTVELSEDNKNITITPNEKDTDATKISVSYTGKDGETKTTTATKADDGTWSITSGDGSVGPDGVVAIPTNLIKGGTEVKAKVTDNGEYDKSNPLQSDEAKLALEKTKTKADKVKELGGLDPVVMKKWVGDKVDWKDGVKAKDDAKKSEVEELLKGATFEDVTEEKRSTTKEGDFEGKIKITFDDKSELVVEKQMLYVSNHVTSTDRKDKVPTDALDVEFKLGEGTKVDNTGSGAIEGNKDKPTSYSKYKVKPNTNLKEYRIPAINASAVDSIKLSAQDGYADPTWNTNNFVATTKNNVFTATATQEFKVNFLPGEGQGSMEEKKVKKGDKFTIPSSKFKAPKDKVFAGWTISGKVGVYQPNGKIDISGNITLTATWKPKPSQPGGPSGPSRPDNGGSDVTPPIIPPIIPEKTPEETPTDTSDPKDSKSPENKPKDKTPGKEDPKNPSGENSKEPGKEKDKNEEGKKPGVEDRLRIRYNPNGGHWNDNSTDILTYYYDRGNIITLINPPTREGYRFLYWKGSAYQPGEKYTVVDDHMFVAQWEKIGTKASRSNPKTGLESVAGIVCTLVGSTGALYIGRKKED